jgi:hypothetical protein
MLFADQVPINSPHSIDALARVGCPDAGSTCLHYVLFALPNLDIAPDGQRDLVQAASAARSL